MFRVGRLPTLNALLSCFPLILLGIFSFPGMSLTAESPVHSSSSSEDFASMLEAELESNSSLSSSQNEPLGQGEEGEEGGQEETGGVSNEVVVEERIKKRKVENIGLYLESTSDSCHATGNKLLSLTGCSHPVVYKGLCTKCGQMVEDNEPGVAFGYIREGLTVHATEVKRLRALDLKSLVCRKKLTLVLDLDHTLLNSTRFMDISPEEDQLLKDLDLMQGDSKRSLFRLGSMHLMTKLRPFVHSFLSEANSMYEMYIYTMGERSYALQIAKILDPGDVYFNSRVICQSDCTQRHQKGLDVVLGDESTVVILDDTETVWQRHRENLILMERYHYFASSSHQFNTNQQSLLLAKKDESETDGILRSILTVLNRVHQMFFDTAHDEDFESRDVRPILRNVRREILQGCNVVFSRIFPSEARAEDQRIWKMCEQLGATCFTEVGPSITHVVSNDRGTEKARWALQNEKFLVNPGWVEGAYHLWRRMSERDFPVSNTSTS